jgi:hypothetical protein
LVFYCDYGYVNVNKSDFENEKETIEIVKGAAKQTLTGTINVKYFYSEKSFKKANRSEIKNTIQ